MLYRIDHLHPDLLVCETYAAVVCPVPLTPPAEPIHASGSLTARQVIEAFPGIGLKILVYDLECSGSGRVSRGGSCARRARGCRAADRPSANPAWPSGNRVSGKANSPRWAVPRRPAAGW
jgi:hypothetical protein